VFFAPDSVWNRPLARDEPLDPRSDVYVQEFLRQIADHPSHIATTAVSVPIYTVSRRTPRVRVRLLNPRAPLLQRALSAVPIPKDAREAPGTDGNLAIWQPSTDTLWEFWRARRSADGTWTAGYGGRMTDVSRNPGYYRDRRRRGRLFERWFWGAPATKTPVVAGVIRLEELRRGRIDHALNFTLAEPRRGVYTSPARATDGISDRPEAIPEGAHFRLDPSLDIDALALPRTARIIAKAIQRYGMILQNRSRGFVLRAEDPYRLGSDPYMGDNGEPGDPGDLFEQRPAELLAQIPWERLQLLPMRLQRQG
jgi:hypothetical protein